MADTEANWQRMKSTSSDHTSDEKKNTDNLGDVNDVEEPTKLVQEIMNELDKPKEDSPESADPEKAKLEKHYRDSLSLLYKFMVHLLCGASFYIIGTRNEWLLFIFTIIWPIILFIIHSFFKKDIFIPYFVENRMVRFKYITFITQNFLLFLFYWIDTSWSEQALSHTASWAYRLNIAEVIYDLWIDRRYLYFLSSFFLFIPLFIGLNDSFDRFPILDMKKHANYIIVWQNWSPWYIVVYTGWFTGWILYRSERITVWCHCMFPLFAPPPLWFSVRTFCGSFMLWFSYLTVTNKITHNPENINERHPFVEIYDPLYFMLLCAAFVMPLWMKAEIV